MALVELLRRTLASEPDLTEPEAMHAYVKHVKKCRKCDPGRGRLCTEGRARFDVWHKAQDEQ